MTVLIVEDDPSDSALLVRALRRAGFAGAILAVCDGIGAQAYLNGASGYEDRQKFPLPDLMIVDLYLPQLPGLELIRWLKSQPRFARIVPVILTGSPFGAEVVDAYKLGAETFFVKPFQKSELEILA